LSIGNISLTGNVSGAPSGSRTFGPLTITANSAVDKTDVVVLASGANTITPPTGATAVVVLGQNSATPTPNPPSAVTLTLKGVTGDTGITVSNKWPVLLSFDTLPGSFVITASSSGATIELWWI
jgi:hypothetical protein